MKRFLSVLLVLALALSLMAVTGFADETTEPVTIKATAVLSRHTFDLETLPSYQRVSEETGVNIDWTYEVSNTWADKKALVLASGDLPEMIYGCYAISTADITQNLDYFLPLNDLIEENCPNIQQMIEDLPATTTSVTWPDGNMYALPHVMPLRPSHFGAAFINQTWLDNLGLEMPTTIEEFTEVMRAFKTGDPNGNGIADEVPMLAWVYNNNFGFRILMGSFGITDSIDSDLAYDNDGNLVYVPATESYREYVKWLHELYSEGLIYSEFLTMGDNYWGLVAQGGECTYGMTCGWTSAHISPDYRDQFAPLPALIGANGEQEWSCNYNMVACGASGYNCASLTIYNEHPAETMKWLDAWYSDEHGIENYFGPIGVCVEKNADGTYTVLESPDPEVDNDTWLWQHGMGDEGPYYVSKATQELIIPNSWCSEKVELDAFYSPYYNTNRAVPALIFDYDTSIAISAYTTDIDRIVTEQRAQWVVEGGVDEGWDDYIASLKRVGLDDYLEIENNALAAFNG